MVLTSDKGIVYHLRYSDAPKLKQKEFIDFWESSTGLPRIKKIAAHSCSLAIVTGPHDTQYQIKDAQQGCKRSPTTTSDRRLPPFPVFLKLTQAYFVERIGQKFTGLRSNWDCHSSHLACKYFASVRKFCVVTI